MKEGRDEACLALFCVCFRNKGKKENNAKGWEEGDLASVSNKLLFIVKREYNIYFDRRLCIVNC